ncbi:MAG: hypothetical protein A2W26_07650 [Acidobacteria bacterium RBG_16_64_8]|nr:MAG: hypothetical protein A2W26_07650 [Acidobacteria bacterium RBG_16_64_8]
MDQRAELTRAALQRLLFWNLKPGQRYVVLASTRSHPSIIDAFLGAAAGLGVDPVLVTIPYRRPFADIPAAAEETLKSADFAIDLQHLTWGYTASHDRVIRSFRERQAFYTAVGGLPEDVPNLVHCPPTEAHRARAQLAQRIIDGARAIRVTTPLGTELRVPRGDPRTLVSFPSAHFGQVAFAPPPGTAEGVVMFQGAVRVQAPDPQTFHVYEPFRIELREGRIVEIDRVHGWAHFLADWFASFGSPEAYQLAHINVGLDERASLVQIDNMSVHFRAGGVLMGFGINWTPLFGTPQGAPLINHVDMHLINVSYFADETQLVDRGRLASALTQGR